MAVAVVATNSEMGPLAGDVTDAASSEDRDVDKERERETRNALLLLLLSVLLVAVAGPVAVWRSHAQPVLLVWRLSVLLCLCAAIWTRVLDATATRARAVLLCASCALALALCANAAAGPEAGALVAHLATHLAAGMLGRALAERRQRDGGAEESAAAVAGRVCALLPRDEHEADTVHGLRLFVAAFNVLVTLGTAAIVAWVVRPFAGDRRADELVMVVSVALSGVLVLWIMFVTGALLRGALVGETGLSLLIMYFMCAVLLYAMAYVIMGGIAAMIITWLAILGIPGFFGYCLYVYASVKAEVEARAAANEAGWKQKGSPTRLLQ
ncbi:hypothetical protein ACP70R_003902 [Stipagrostis hirtigluma subsp. patula]